jgi:hypothetical protein
MENDVLNRIPSPSVQDLLGIHTCVAVFFIYHREHVGEMG